jgi:predicted DNA-binding protein
VDKCSESPISVKMAEELLHRIDALAGSTDVTRSELIKAAIEISLPLIEKHPFLVKILQWQEIERNKT